MSPVTQLEPEVLKARIERFRQVQSEIVTQVRRVIVGQEEVLDQVMIALFVGGHCLITGLPGTAKTLLVRTMAQTLGLVFKRIQFTPDPCPQQHVGQGEDGAPQEMDRQGTIPGSGFKVETSGEPDHRHGQQGKDIPIAQRIVDSLPPGNIQPGHGTGNMKLAGKGEADQGPEDKTD